MDSKSNVQPTTPPGESKSNTTDNAMTSVQNGPSNSPNLVDCSQKQWGFAEPESLVADDLGLSVQQVQELYNKTGWVLQQKEGDLHDF